ncbi:chain-length determining protein [Glaciecola sp. XM2]|uniref:XrtA system polysaccharide chain length determinant n=1 Tax=Glaciecola sp. XM2 TaxID=1914931 RepID=UPI001BDEAE6D|nr:XrtA system polysaccharide chain length determinant [Glaciecola sp. XM2]MBT1450634.1 chain-length determining protein [Glaciecola sp. XM2]
MQDLQETIQLILDYFRGIWIRKRYLIISSWLLCPIGFVFVANLPNTYESRAQVFVDTRSMLAPLLQGISISSDPELEVQMMTQTLLSRTNVEIIARESDLDITAQTEREYEQLIIDLTQDIQLRPVGRDNVFTISYTANDAILARTVVQETLDLFVEGSLVNNRRDTDTANRFLDEQIADYESRLATAERDRADFRRQYADILPLSGTFHSNLQNMREQLAQTRLSIREGEQQAESLKARLTGKRATSDSFSVREDGAEPAITSRFDERIIALEANLDFLQLRFTDKHPDVIETIQLIDSLKAAREREIQAFLNQEDGDDIPLNTLNQEITLEISKLEGTIASLKVREADYVSKIEDLQSKIDLVPQIEAEGQSRNRNYDIIKDKYEELLARKESADLTQRADASSNDLQFRIIQPPLAPQEATGPNRMIFYTVVLIVGFGVGGGVAFLLSQITPVLVRGTQLSTVSNFPILGAVTHLQIDDIKRRNRWRMVVFALSSGTIFLIYLTFVVTDLLNINLLSEILP